MATCKGEEKGSFEESVVRVVSIEKVEVEVEVEVEVKVEEVEEEEVEEVEVEEVEVEVEVEGFDKGGVDLNEMKCKKLKGDLEEEERFGLNWKGESIWMLGCFRRSSTTSSCPFCAAIQSGVRFAADALGQAFAARSRGITAVWPLRAAIHSGVRPLGCET